jgi:hypothetical protein
VHPPQRPLLVALWRGNVAVGTAALGAAARGTVSAAKAIVAAVKVPVGTGVTIDRRGAIWFDNLGRSWVALGRADSAAVALGTKRGSVAATAATVTAIVESVGAGFAVDDGRRRCWRRLRRTGPRKVAAAGRSVSRAGL